MIASRWSTKRPPRAGGQDRSAPGCGWACSSSRPRHADRRQSRPRRHDRRRHRQHAERRTARSRPGGHPAVFDRRRRSSCWRRAATVIRPGCSTRRAEVRAIDAEQPLGRPITLSEVLGQDVCSPGSRWRCSARSPGSAWRWPRSASTARCRSTRPSHTRTRRPDGARRAAPPGARLMLGMGARLVLVGLAPGVVPRPPAGISYLAADRSACLRRGDPRARRDRVPGLLPAGAPRRRRQSDGGAAPGLSATRTPDAGSRSAAR